MQFDPNKVTFFAKTDARGKSLPFGIKAKDRQRHMYVIGKTGMGKSTMLENMAVQDIQNGEGLAFIDPHGSTAEKLLEYVPEHRIKDVVYFAPFDMEHPIAFNVMEDVGPDKRHLVVSGLMSTFKKIWVDAWSARMEYILTNTLLALLEYPDSTLLSVNPMLADKEYRKKVVANIKDPAVKAFWVDEFANYTDRFAAEATPAIQNKIGQFTGNPLIRNIIGQPKSSFDIRTMMDEQKILIMNLSKGLVGETNANLLGSMLTTRIYLAAMSRADLSPQAMQAAPNFYFYVDEFQSFANTTFANILSEARKYKLNLTIAHQYIEQMEEEVRDAVFGNVGTTVTFRVGPFDAETLETVFTPTFLAPDIVNLGFAQIYLTLMIDGIGSQPFSAVTLPPIAPPQRSCKDMVIASSRTQFTHSRSEVEAMIAAFHAPAPTPPNQNGNGKERKTDGGNGKQEYRRDTPKSERPADKPPRELPKTEHVPEVKQESAREKIERPQRSTQHNSERQDTQKPNNLNDLRSVLKNISRAESGNSQPEKPKQHGGKQESRAVGGDLKQLLKQVLANVPKSEAVDSAPPAAPTPSPTKSVIAPVVVPDVVEVTPPIAKEKDSPTPISDQKTEPVPNQDEKSVDARMEKLTKDRTISPRELERMMRVTTSDQTPFK